MTFQRILVALDRSSQAPLVFERALEQAIAAHSQLHLVHILPIDADLRAVSLAGVGTLADVDLYGTLKHLQHERLQKELETAQQWLHPYCERAIAQGVEADVDCRAGEPSVLVCDLARTWGADLIVLGRRGHQGIREVVLGSVSNYVIHNAPCSVLVVQGLPDAVSEPASSVGLGDVKESSWS